MEARAQQLQLNTSLQYIYPTSTSYGLKSSDVDRLLAAGVEPHKVAVHQDVTWTRDVRSRTCDTQRHV